MTSVIDRIDHVLAGRSAYSVLLRAGFSHETVRRFLASEPQEGEKERKAPSDDTLTRLIGPERLKPDWLWNDEGAPYAVSVLERLSDLQDYLPSADRVLFLHNDNDVCLCIGTSVQKIYGKKSVDYREWVLFRSTKSAELIEALHHHAELAVASVTPKLMVQIQAGYIGNWPLFGDFGGTRGAENALSIWANSERPKSYLSFRAMVGMQRIAQPGVNPSSQAEDAAVMIDVSALDAEQRAAVELIVQLMGRR